MHEHFLAEDNYFNSEERSLFHDIMTDVQELRNMSEEEFLNVEVINDEEVNVIKALLENGKLINICIVFLITFTFNPPTENLAGKMFAMSCTILYFQYRTRNIAVFLLRSHCVSDKTHTWFYEVMPPAVETQTKLETLSYLKQSCSVIKNCYVYVLT